MTATESPARKPRRNQGAGCWLVGFGSLGLAMLLALIGLLLPPFSLPDRLLGLQYQSLSAQMPAVSLDDEFAVSLIGEDGGDEFALRLSQAPPNDFESDDAWRLARRHLPHYLTLQSPLYTIAALGDAPDRLQFSLDLPPDAPAAQTLSLYGWDGGQWRFIPSTQTNDKAQGIADFLPRAIAVFQARPPAPIVAVSYDIRQELTAEAARLATIISPAGLRPSPQGGLIGSLAPGADADSAYLFMPRIANYDDPRAVDIETVEAIVSHPTWRGEHAAQIAAVASYNRFDGVFVDYRGLSDAVRDDFSQFIAQLGASFAEQGLRLGLVAPPPRYQDGSWDTGAYDWRALGAAVDYFQLSADLHPTAFAAESSPSAAAMLRWAVDEVDRYKILLGLSAQSVRDGDGGRTRIGWRAALAGLGDVALTADQVSETGSVEPGQRIRAARDGQAAAAGFDAALNAPFLDYLADNGDEMTRIWFTTAAALRHRMEYTLAFALAGVAFDDLLADDLLPGLSAAVLRYKARAPRLESSAGLALRWSIEGGGGGGMVDRVTTGLNDDLLLTLTAPEGNYAVNMAVIGLDAAAESQRQGAALALFAPTATPTPTPTPTPIPTARPAVAAPPAHAGPVNFAAAAPPPGSITIEIGGHVTHAGSSRAVGAMKAAGMTWMKIQARYVQNGPPDVAQQIAIAHSSGFKILVGTVGHPGELGAGGQGYINGYTAWLERIAAQGADAIEVWNEPNLDREWPRGQISGESYAQMLKTAYRKIKAANPSTMVISAAPAPTGVSDRPNNVMPDNQWLREMVDAGGLDYLDCVGAHYNEGIVPPSQTSGDPRGDNYYTRYFYGMLNGYISITRKPICFTELGYVSSEGHPPLPPGFIWARNVTVAQQAAWLAQAAALASQSGQVRLFIVWNIDFTHYSAGRGGDPQAGYAIIRPGGACPACASLAQAR